MSLFKAYVTTSAVAQNIRVQQMILRV